MINFHKIKAFDDDGTTPIMSISGPNVLDFNLIRNEIYSKINITRDFFAKITIIAADEENLNSRTYVTLTIKASKDWAAIISGITCGILLFLMIISVFLFRNCPIHKYRFYDRIITKTKTSENENRVEQIIETPTSPVKITVDISENWTETTSKICSKIKFDSDSGRGDSSSEDQLIKLSMGKWCNDECLTLGHSDACWLPRINVENHLSVVTKKKSGNKWDSDSCYSSHIEGETI